MSVSKSRSFLRATRQSECAYCSTPLTEDTVKLKDGRKYHKVCAEAKKLREMYPSTFNSLDRIRATVENLYEDEVIVVQNSDTLATIEMLLNTFKKQ